MRTRHLAYAILIATAAAAPANAEGDAAAGAKVFNKCKACHEATGDKNKVGPNLATVVGRPAASLESYAAKYSKAMKEKAEEGLVWDEANLAEYLRAPKAVVPGGTMAFGGLKKDDEIEDVIAYLKADPKP